MSKLIGLSIDVSKIDKSRLIKGKKGSYLNLTVEVKDVKDQYGNDVTCWEGQTKEEREAKKERNFLGNGRVIWEGKRVEVKSDSTPPDDNTDLPF